MDITCCNRCRHDDKLIPLIWTFAFPGAEWWCPNCGQTYGMFDGYHETEETPELVKLREDFEKGTEEYRHAIGVTHCSSMQWEGKQIEYAELPVEEKKRLQKIREQWKYGDLYEKLKSPQPEA